MGLVRLCVAVIVGWMSSAGFAVACSCFQTTFEDGFRSSYLVFEGTAVSTQRIGAPDDDSAVVTTFKVTRAIKGTGFETRDIRHDIPDGGNCGISFEIGTPYRVFAYGSRGNFGTGACSRTQVLDGSTLWRRLRPDAPVPAETLEEVIQQIRNPKLSKDEAEFLFDEYQEREQDEKTKSFIESYIARAASASEQARGGDIISWGGPMAVAKFYESWGDYERAAEMYALLEKAAPEDARGPAHRGRALFLAGHPSQAIPPLERAIRLDTDHIEAQVYLARARLIAEGGLTRQINDYREISAGKLDIGRAKHPGINLSGSTIHEFSAKAANLPRAKFGSVEFSKADFREANLTESNFVGARIANADFSQAVLRNAYMIGAFFEGVDFSGSDLTGVRVRGSEFNKGDFRGSSLPNANLAVTALYRANFEGVNLQDADLTGARMMNALLQGADLRGAKVKDALLIGARVDCKTQLPARISVKKAGLIPVQTPCAGRPQNRDFSNRNWKSADFSQLDLSGASFANAEFDLMYADDGGFTGARLANAKFSGTTGRTKFAGADLRNADFSKSEMKGHFYGVPADQDRPKPWPPANLTGTDFSGAKLETSSFIGGRLSRPLPQRAQYETATFSGTRLKCSLGTSAAYIERKAKEEIEPVDPSQLYGPLWDRASEIERKRALENAKAMHIREAEERKREAALVQAERDMVAFLREKWPSVTFDASCQYYLAAPRAKPEN